MSDFYGAVRLADSCAADVHATNSYLRQAVAAATDLFDLDRDYGHGTLAATSQRRAKGRPKGYTKLPSIDLHWHSVQTAVYILDEYLPFLRVCACCLWGQRCCVPLITGWGKNSPDHIPRVQPVVLEWLQSHGWAHEFENRGKILVYLSQPTC